MEYADLHIHTNASDGILTPEEVVEWAYKKKLKAISITDHDTVSGIDRAIKANKVMNSLEIIPGIELNTDYNGEEIHILGYCIDYKNTWFLDILKNMQQSRYERALKMVHILNEFNIMISMDQVQKISKGSSIGRPHVARAMIESGYIDNIKDGFDKYLGKGRPAYVERFKLESKQAVEIINKTGGIAVLAHPGLIKNKRIISSIINLGIQGIEVYHTKHDLDTIRYLKYISKEKELLITGGTDCHGIMVNNQPILGNVKIDYNNVIKLKNAAKNNRRSTLMQFQISERASNINPSLTIAIDAKLKQMLSEGKKVYGFGAGEPDFDTPKYIKDAAIEAINNGFTRYTAAQGTLDLRTAICAKLERENNLKYNQNQIVASSGAKHSLSNSFAAILNQDDEVIVPVPYWVSYTEIIKLNGGIPVLVNTDKENDFKITKEQFESALTNKTKAIIINNPNNPTGSVYKEDELRAIADVAIKNNIYIVSDEIYERLTYDGIKHISIASLSEEIKDITILINGMSKTYAMTGWRLGYAACNEKIAKAISSIQSHAVSHPSSITQYASTAALNGPQDDVELMIEEYRKRREYMYEKINSIEGMSCSKPEGAFYLYVDISKLLGHELKGFKINSSMDLAVILLEQANIAVIPGIAFGADDYIRLSYATSMKDIVNGLNVLEVFLRDNLK